MGWKANATITNVNSVGAVTLQALAEDITCDGDDQVTQVDVTVRYVDASHLAVGNKLTVSGDC